jgi:hypothetical protein
MNCTNFHRERGVDEFCDRRKRSEQRLLRGGVLRADKAGDREARRSAEAPLHLKFSVLQNPLALVDELVKDLRTLWDT